MKNQSFLMKFFNIIKTSAQVKCKIKGCFDFAVNKNIRLIGYKGVNEIMLYKTKSDKSGNFVLKYPKNYLGVATIEIKETTSLKVILKNENFKITSSKLNNYTFSDSDENTWLHNANNIKTEVQYKLSGLSYMLPFYQLQKSKNKWDVNFDREIAFQNNRLDEYILQLPENSFSKSYLNYREIYRKLRDEKISLNTNVNSDNSLLTIDFNDMNLFYTGLVKKIFDEYIKQIIKLQNQACITNCFNELSNFIVKSTENNPIVFNDYAEYLLKQYEKNGLHEASEQIALSLLNNYQNIISSDFLSVLEIYKKLMIGNEAPNLKMINNHNYKYLSDIKSRYKLVVFGASWCKQCKMEIPKLKDYASFFKDNYDGEIVYVSLDTDKKKHNGFTKDFPFVNNCDYKSWGSNNVRSYNVFTLPKIFIINDENIIIDKPKSTFEILNNMIDFDEKNSSLKNKN